jgi:hypothetical protein
MLKKAAKLQVEENRFALGLKVGLAKEVKPQGRGGSVKNKQAKWQSK